MPRRGSASSIVVPRLCEAFVNQRADIRVHYHFVIVVVVTGINELLVLFQPVLDKRAEIHGQLS
jgi:MFS-type transporter involved in bile tolerance (Atg22 family)